MQIMRYALFIFVFLIMVFDSHAEEGGSGHYLPGSMASSIDGVPLEETFLTRLNVINYSGDFKKKNITIPIAGLAATEVNVESQAIGLTMLWRPPLDIGKRWSYAMSATIPYVFINVQATVNSQGSISGIVRREDSSNGLGDIILQPLILNYNISPAWNTNFRISVYAPTGDYEVGKLANTGKNFWTLEPTLASIYLNPNTGLEFSVFAGIDFNEENSDTNYQSGNQAHLESTLMQHLPLWGGNGGIGVTGYWYKQVTDDTGDGANYGAFKAKTVGAGPVLAYSMKAGKVDLIAELKWLHEFETARRAEGDTVFLKVVSKF